MKDTNGSKLGFQRRPPESDTETTVEVRRVAPGRPIRGIVLSHDLAGRFTHWFGGRTVPCHDGECKACNESVERRWKGWLAIYNPDTRGICILEITPKTVPPIDEYFRAHRTLRGAQITASRIGKKDNGKVVATLCSGPIHNDDLPTCPQVEKVLLKMWGVEAPLAPSVALQIPRSTFAPANGAEE